VRVRSTAKLALLRSSALRTRRASGGAFAAPWEAARALAGLKALAVGSTPLRGSRALPPDFARAVLGWLRDEHRGVGATGPFETARSTRRRRRCCAAAVT